MATLASNVSWGSSPTNTFDFSYEKKREGATQYYKVTVSCDPCTGSSYFGYPIYLEIKLDGSKKATKTLKAASPSQWSSALSYTTDWLEVSNKTDGTTALAIRIYSGLGSSRNKTYSYSLPIDPAASKISATDANIESTSTISITKYDADFTTTVSYKADGESSYTAIWTKQKHTSYGWTVPDSLYSLIKSAKKIEVTLRCQTYSGSTLIGTETCTLTATTSESKCKPTVSVTAVDTNSDTIALTGSNKKIIKGFSDVKVTTTATAKNSADISSVSVTCGSAKKTGTSVTFSDAESATIKATAKDSRGYSNSAKASGMTLVNYIVPTIVASISRESPTSDVVNISVSGKWFNGGFGSVTNTLKLQVKYKPKSQSAYADSDKYLDMTVKTSGNTYTATLSISGLEYTNAYSIRIRASDAIHVYGGPLAEPIYKNTELSKGVPVFDWGEEDFQFNVPVNMPKNRYFIDDGDCGLDMKNSDIVNVNALFFADEASSGKEGIGFYRDGANWDSIWAKDGVLYFTPNYPAQTTNYYLFLSPGREVSIGSQTVAFSGFVTDSTKRLTFTIPLSRPALGVSSVTITGNVLARGIAGYIVGTGSSSSLISMDAPSGYTVSCAINISGISVTVQFDEAIPYATNNTAVTVTPYGTIKITFA